MAGNRYVPTIFTATDTNGAPIAGARLYFYENNTTTPKDTWSDIDLTTSNDWPVLADGSGRFSQDIFMDTDPYRIKLTDENGVQIWLKDDCNTFNGAIGAATFPFEGAVIEFYGSQTQLDVATANFWYLMDGTSGNPNLNGLYTKACISVAAIGTSGGSLIPTGTVGSHTLTAAELPAHFHYIANTDDTSTATPSITDTTYLTQSNTGGGNPQYDLNGSATTATVGKTSSTGSSSGHDHSLTMDTYNPPFYQLIKLVYVGS